MDIKLDNEKLHGEITIPPSISLLHLSLIAAALTGLQTGNTDAWDNLAGKCISICEDLANTIKGLQVLVEKVVNGVPRRDSSMYEKTMKGLHGSKELNMGMLPKTTIKCGDSDETMKLFMPIASALGIDISYMCGRTLYGARIETIAEQLEKHGAFIMKAPICTQAVNASGMICVSGQLLPGAYILPSNIPVEFVAGLLFALAINNSKSTIRILGTLQSLSFLQLALHVLDDSGINIRTNTTYTEFEIEGNQNFNLKKAETSGDWNIGAYFVTAGALGRIFDTRGQFAKPIIYPSIKDNTLACGNINVHGLSFESSQDSKEIVSIINKMSDNLGSDLEFAIEKYPELVPVLTVYAAVRIGITTFTGTMKLHAKEGEGIIRHTCDLIRSLGGTIKADNNCITIYGRGGLLGGTIDPHNNPRIVMAAAIAARICEESVVIKNAECVSRLYSNFFEEYGSLQW